MPDSDIPTCDNVLSQRGNKFFYCPKPWTRKVKGEQDSFGIEWLYYCESCYQQVTQAWRAARTAQDAKNRSGYCRACKKHDDDLVRTTAFNDNSWEEAIYACRDCICKILEELEAEIYESTFGRTHRKDFSL